MMEGFCKSDEQKRSDSEVQKRYADPIAGLKKSADKKQVEQQKQKKRKCQIKLVGIHQDVYKRQVFIPCSPVKQTGGQRPKGGKQHEQV